jgi:lysozyme
METMRISNNGLSLIKGFEGLRLHAYKDIAGVWTIGYGSTRYQNGSHVKPGDKLNSEEQATGLFLNTLGQYEEAVNSYVKVPINQNQFDALVSFTYNEGTGALHESSLLILLNENDFEGAAEHFLLWNKITDPETGKKVVSDTLSHRRKIESQLFLTPIT